MRHRALAAGIYLVLVAMLTAGCHHAPKPTPSADKQVVPVSQPIVEKVTDYLDFTGRTDAVYMTDIRPRVTGYLTKMPFSEGAEVKKDNLLFEVDPRPYKAAFDRAVADVELMKAKYKLAVADNVRAKNVAKMNPGAISKQDLDKYAAAEGEADAAVKSSQANQESAKLNLDFCQVTSPIDGRISRYYYTLGNLVNQDQTVLTSVVSVDPMYVYFDVDERSLLRFKDMINAGKLKALTPGSHDYLVSMGLANEEGFPHEGYINFVNNKVDPLTGTITVRGVFKNPLSPQGIRLLAPGMFVRVRLPMGPPHEGLLIAQKALGLDQGLPFVYVVGDDSKVAYRRVAIGQPQPNGLIDITEGLKPGEWVVVSGLQLVRPGMEVTIDKVPMPTTVVPRVESAAKTMK